MLILFFCTKPFKTLKFLFLIVYFSGLFFLLCFSACLFIFDYESLIFWVLDFYQQTSKIKQFRNLLTESRFQILQIFAVFFLGFYISVFFIISKIFFIITFYLKELQTQLTAFGKIFALLSRREKIVLWLAFSLITSLKLYFVFEFPLLLDEVFTYIFFVDKGFLVSMAYYPGPNNHIFFSLVGVISDFFFQNIFTEPVFALRLISCLAVLFCSLFLFAWLKVKNDFWIAFYAFLCFHFSIPVFLYGILGRGYALQLIFICVAAFAALKMIENPKSNFSHLIFILSSVLGFYTIPTFLYPFGAFCVFLFLEKQFFNIYIWIDLITIVILTVMLYLPIILFNGLQSISGNSWVLAMNFNDFMQKLPVYLLEIGDFFFPNFAWLFWILIFAMFLGNLSITKPLKIEIKLLFCFVFISFLMLLFQRLQPFVRVWTYWSIVLIWLLALVLQNDNLQKYKHLIGIFAVFVFLIFWKNEFQFVHNKPDYQHFPEKIAQNKQINRVFVNEDVYANFLHYESLKKMRNLEIEVNIFDETIKYDCLILDKKRNIKGLKLEFYREIFANDVVLVFERK